MPTAHPFGLPNAAVVDWHPIQATDQERGKSKLTCWVAG